MQSVLTGVLKKELQSKLSWRENEKSYVLVEDGIKKVLSLVEVKSNEGTKFDILGSIQLKKKVDSIILYKEKKYLIDKCGDIYEIQIREKMEESTAILQNNTFSQITCCLPIEDKNMLILIDEYYKIKMYSLDNLEQILKIYCFRKIFIRKIFNINGKLVIFFEDSKYIVVDLEVFLSLEDEEDLLSMMKPLPEKMISVSNDDTRTFSFFLDIFELEAKENQVLFAGVDNYKKFEIVYFNLNLMNNEISFVKRVQRFSNEEYRNSQIEGLKKVKTNDSKKSEKVIVDNTWRKDFKDRNYHLKKAGTIVKKKDVVPYLMIRNSKFEILDSKGKFSL
jgi:hypothetical protein